MKKLAAAALILGTLSTGSVWAHEAGEFFIRAGTATVRPTEGSDNVLGSLGSFNVSNNTQLGLTFTYMATDNIGVELLAATPFRHKGRHQANRDYRHRPSAAAHPDGAVVLWRCAKQGAPVRGGRYQLHHLL